MRNNAVVQIGRGARAARFGASLPLALIAGPCQIESRAHALETAAALKEIAARLAVGLVYKSSFDKANRTSGASARGIGLEASLPIFAEIRETLGLPVITDVHESGQCAPVAEAVDALQIPAFLCRQTDLLVAAARTGRAVNVKKGQFLAPWDMKNVVAKLDAAGAGRRSRDRARREFRLQHARQRHAGAADHGARDGRAGDFRRDPFGAAAGRAGDVVRRPARVRRGAGPRGGRGRRGGRFHRDPSGSGQGALATARTWCRSKDFEALVAELQDFDRLAKRRRVSG